MKNGGQRKGAGRKPGGKNKKTLEQKAVADAFNQRVMIAADALFNAQLKLATGSQKIFRIDETEVDGKIKRTHELVTDADEIKELLDEHGGGDGEVDGNYYYFQTVMPDNRAIDSLLNRALGKPKDSLDVNHGGEVKTTSTIIIQGVEGTQKPNDGTTGDNQSSE